MDFNPSGFRREIVSRSSIKCARRPSSRRKVSRWSSCLAGSWCWQVSLYRSSGWSAGCAARGSHLRQTVFHAVQLAEASNISQDEHQSCRLPGNGSREAEVDRRVPALPGSFFRRAWLAFKIEQGFSRRKGQLAVGERTRAGFPQPGSLVPTGLLRPKTKTASGTDARIPRYVLWQIAARRCAPVPLFQLGSIFLRALVQLRVFESRLQHKKLNICPRLISFWLKRCSCPRSKALPAR